MSPTQQHINVPANFLDNVVDYVEVSSLATKKALDEVAVHRQSHEKAAALVDPLLKRMLEVGVIDGTDKEAAEVMLQSHDTTLQLLKAAVDKLAETKSSGGVPEPGRATDDPNGHSKQGSDQGDYDSLTNPVVGARSQFVKASDLPLLKAAGLR